MQALDIHKSIVDEYKSYLKGFTSIRDERVKKMVDHAIGEGEFIPEALIQFNPSFDKGASLQDLVNEGVIHKDLIQIFGGYNLYYHQEQAIRNGAQGKGFVVTSGTGSGKSLTYLATLFNRILKVPGSGVRALIVYPMNALINSQEEEIKKFEINYLKRTNSLDFKGDINNDDDIAAFRLQCSVPFPFSYGKYTGQEDQAKKNKLLANPPHILLTNYMMLELMMTRAGESKLRDLMKESLEYLVFDELHTYRGRQGSDVSMLIRRIRQLCSKEVICIGTSATMATGDTQAECRETVAEVASRIFSATYSSNDVIGERLTLCTQSTGGVPSQSDLQEAVLNLPVNMDDPSEFTSNPLVIWLENKIALEKDPNGELVRGIPFSLRTIAERLSADSGQTVPTCEKALRNLLSIGEKLNTEGAKKAPRESYLPFKIHQFISQTGNVLVTLDSREDRKITLKMGRYEHEDGKDRLLYPLLFNRYSGYDYLSVRKVNDKLMPRDPSDFMEDEELSDTNKKKKKQSRAEYPDGYLLLPLDPNDEIITEDIEELFPDEWFAKTKQRELKKEYQARMPELLYIGREGDYTYEETNDFHKAYFIPAPMLFEPITGMIYETRVKESTKLSSIGSEGRSTATTVMSYAIIRSQREADIATHAQKLMSFTDNRQDASLQAGHFNDFILMGRLRSAICHAMKNASKECDVNDIIDKVLKHLKLNESEYALRPSQNPKYPLKENEEALRYFLFTRIVYDLRRGWRYTTPNLEQTALLDIDYLYLDEVAKDEELWKAHTLFKGMNSEERKVIIAQVLHYFRTSYAIDHAMLFHRRADIQEKIKNVLDPNQLWSLGEDDNIEVPATMFIQKVEKFKTQDVFYKSAGSRSYLGRYLKRIYNKKGFTLDKGELELGIEELLNALVEPSLLIKVTCDTNTGETVTGFRLKLDSILWKLGDGKTVNKDDIYLASLRDFTIPVNQYFRKFYQQDFSRFESNLLAREHTGQISTDLRIAREKDFRSGEISALYCSPTMELGIDVSELNVVHMRNVPPTPANYAQRSGRAGRSGQAALVFTYCAQRSPHDQHYFKDSPKMISGKVVPPKIDLSSEELILSHLNAFLLMNIELTELQDSVNDLLEIEEKAPRKMLLKDSVRNTITYQIENYGGNWLNQFHKMLEQQTNVKDEYWYTDQWLKEKVTSFLSRLDESLNRWRMLYRAAREQKEKSDQIVNDPTLTVNNPIKKDAKRNAAIALRQMELLTNSLSGGSFGNSEFYVFRYLASEGFLPGYNFTRLPVRCFVGKSYKGEGEYISRPRFVALREFGPQNMIYHNGNKFRVERMKLSVQDNNPTFESLLICKETGYVFLNEEAKGINNDLITGKSLEGGKALKIGNLLPLGETEAFPRDRISCEEEERVQTGYEINQFVTFNNVVSQIQKATITEQGEGLLQVIFSPASRMLQLNKGWRRRKNDTGFSINTKTGRFEAPKNDSVSDYQNIVVYTTTTSDTLYIQPVSSLELDESGVITLSYALKKAIEQLYQLEESELGVWIMGDGEQKNIMLYEGTEGTLGILTELAQSGEKLKHVFRLACELIHYDVASGKDLAPNLPCATYDDLLSYYNQRHHDKINRHAIAPALRRLYKSGFDFTYGNSSTEQQYDNLQNSYDQNSATEKPLIDYLKAHGLRLPDQAQYNVPECYVSADFVYFGEYQATLVFCDGSVHDSSSQKAEDKRKRDACRDQGYDVIEWHYTESVESLVERRKDIFRKVN